MRRVIIVLALLVVCGAVLAQYPKLRCSELKNSSVTSCDVLDADSSGVVGCLTIGGMTQNATPGSGDLLICTDSDNSDDVRYCDIGDLPAGAETNSLETTCTNIAQYEILVGASADTGLFTTIGALAEEEAPDAGDFLLCTDDDNGNELRKCDVGDLPAGAEVNDLSAAVTWANVPDANVAGADERDEVCGTTTLSSSCEVLWAQANDMDSNGDVTITEADISDLAHTADEVGTLTNGDLCINDGSAVQCTVNTIAELETALDAEDILTATEGNAAYQPLDAELTTLAGLTEAQGSIIIGDATPAWSALAIGTGVLLGNGTTAAWDGTPAIDCTDCTNIPAASSLGDVGDVTLTTPGDGAVLCFTGTDNASVDCTVGGDLTATEDSGTITYAVAGDSVALTTDTTGNYVASVADAGNSTITPTNCATEGGACTIDVIDVHCTDCLSATEIEDVYALHAGDAYTNLHDFGGASLEIPNGDPTVDAAGEIGWDTTAVPATGGEGQLVVHDGSSGALTIPVVYPVCFTIENLAADDDGFSVWAPPFAVTITSGWCSYQGTGTTPATVDFSDAEGNVMTMTDITCGSANAGTVTPQAVTGGNTLAAYESMAFYVTNAVNPETDKYTICWTYTVTRQ